jgi:ABC-type sugar transport system permease subunit
MTVTSAPPIKARPGVLSPESSGRTGPDRQVPRVATSTRKKRNRKAYGLFALLAFPNMILIAVFAYWPVVGNIFLSLTSWDMVAPQPLFIGIDNYIRLFTDPDFMDVMGRTLVWVSAVVVLSLVLGLAMAFLFSLRAPGTPAVTAMAFSPHVISGAAVAAIWLFIFDPNFGLSRALFAVFGGDSPSWTTDASWALPALIIVAVWKGVGFVAIVYLAALQGIPQDIQEAARLDGANRWQVLRHVIMPLLSPTTFFLTITQIISAFQSFDLVAMMTGGGPAGSTTTLSWFIYEQGFQSFDAGYAAAASVLMFVILLGVTAAQLRYSERKVHY